MDNSITVKEAGKLGGSSTSKQKAASSRTNGLKGGRPISDITFNERGGINGCSHIYAPKGQAYEYAELATNPYSGCGHRCAYCYVPKILRMNDRRAFDSAALPRKNFLKFLERDAKKYAEKNIKKQIMLSFTTDPYHPFDTSLTRKTIELLKSYNLTVSILTKGGHRALRDADLLRQDQDCFGSTITSTDDAFCKKWESGAAMASERIDAIKKFHELGFFTWVSIEPTIDTDHAINVINSTHEFVDFYKIGRINYSQLTKQADWREYTLRVIDVLNKKGIKHYIKKDLQPYLPSGYQNPLRVKQSY